MIFWSTIIFVLACQSPEKPESSVVQSANEESLDKIKSKLFGRWEATEREICLSLKEDVFELSFQRSQSPKIRIYGDHTIQHKQNQTFELTLNPQSISQEKYIYPCRKRIAESGYLDEVYFLGKRLEKNIPVNINLTYETADDTMKFCLKTRTKEHCEKLQRVDKEG